MKRMNYIKFLELLSFWKIKLSENLRLNPKGLELSFLKGEDIILIIYMIKYILYCYKVNIY